MNQGENLELFQQANSDVEAMNGFIGGGDGGYAKNQIDKTNDTLTFGLVNPTTSKLSVSLMGMDSGITTTVNPPPTNPIFFGAISVGNSILGANSICTPNNTIYISDLVANIIIVIDGSNGLVITNIALPPGFTPAPTAYCPVNNQIYVGSSAFPQAIRIDCATNTIIGAPIVLTNPVDVIIGFVYNSVKNSMYSISISEISCTSNTEVFTALPPPGLLSYLVFNPLLNRVYYTNFVTNALDVLDCSTNLFLPSIPLPLFNPIGIVYSSYNNSVYVSEQAPARNIVQVNCSTLVVGAPVSLGAAVAEPRAMAYNPINNLIYAGGSVTPNYVVFDVLTNTVSAPIALGMNTKCVIFNQNNNQINFLEAATSVLEIIAPILTPSVVVTLQGGVTPAEIFNDLQGKPLFFSGLKMILSDLNQLFNNMTVQYTSITGKVESSQLQPTNNVSPSNRNSNIVDITDFEFAADTNSQISFDMEPLSTMTMAFSLRRQVSNVSFDSPNNNSVEKRENVRISGNPILDILLVQDEEEYQRKKNK